VHASAETIGSQREHPQVDAPSADLGLGHATTSSAKDEKNIESRNLIRNSEF